jgi:polar amino acid transport system permease protein
MSHFLSTLMMGLATTIVITLVSFVAAAILGLPVVFACRSKIALLRWLGTAYVEIARGIPPIAWMLILYFGLSRVVALEPIPAACSALALVYAAYMAENYRAAIDAVNPGQWEAAHALGMNSRDVFWRIIAPQGAGVALPPSATNLIGLLKDSATASVIGVTDIAFQALVLTQQGHSGLIIFTLAGIVYLLLGIPLAVLARGTERFVRARVAV